MKNKKILAVVPARGGSKGIKRKNLCKLNQKTLIELAANQIKNIHEIDFSLISSDDEEMISEGIKYGLNAPFIRPEDLSGDQVSDVEVLTHALIESEKHTNYEFDIILMIQPTSPMRIQDDIYNALNKLIDNGYDSVFSVSKTDSKAHPLKQFQIDNDKLTFYDKEGVNIIARQQLKDTFHKDGIVYAMTRECLLNQKTIMGKNPSYILIERETVNIDTKTDLLLAEILMNKSGI
tara:strand:+ start:160 stop:864 length:705 start_codon:yes stop_codon:yes gene_type:complete